MPMIHAGDVDAAIGVNIGGGLLISPIDDDAGAGRARR